MTLVGPETRDTSKTLRRGTKFPGTSGHIDNLRRCIEVTSRLSSRQG